MSFLAWVVEDGGMDGGEVLESVFTPARDKKDALNSLGKAMRRQGRPEALVTERPPEAMQLTADLAMSRHYCKRSPFWSKW